MTVKRSDKRCIRCEPKDWTSTADPRRKGWVKVTCRACGKFVGYYPPGPKG